MNIWSIIDHIFSKRCVLCLTRANGLCVACEAALPRNQHPCARCALPLPTAATTARLCAACQASNADFDRILAPLLYRTPVNDLVARFKYHDRLDLGRILAAQLLAEVAQHATRPALLLPVPMDAAGLRTRGYNQAGELARHLSAALDIPWSAAQLKRNRGAAHQRGLDRAARQRNLRGAFSCHGHLPRHVAVVDDVVTTGATAAEISTTLRRAGAKRVEIWAVARTPAVHDSPRRGFF